MTGQTKAARLRELIAKAAIVLPGVPSEGSFTTTNQLTKFLREFHSGRLCKLLGIPEEDNERKLNP